MTLPIPELIAALENLFVYIIRATQNKAIVVITIYLYIVIALPAIAIVIYIEVKIKDAKSDK